MDKVNHTRGLIDSFNVVYPQLADLDFAAQATQLQVPVYFFVGRNDVNAMARWSRTTTTNCLRRTMS